MQVDLLPWKFPGKLVEVDLHHGSSWKLPYFHGNGSFRYRWKWKLAFNIISFIFFWPHFFCQLLDKPWSQVSWLLPSRTFLQFLSRIGFRFPTPSRFSSNVANSFMISCLSRVNLCRRKVPTIIYEYALGGTRTHAIYL